MDPRIWEGTSVARGQVVYLTAPNKDMLMKQAEHIAGMSKLNYGGYLKIL